MNNIGHSQAIGMCDKYFDVIKCQHPYLYDKYLEYGKGNISVGYQKAENRILDLIVDATSIYYFLKSMKGRAVRELLVKSNEDYFMNEACHRATIMRLLFSKGSSRYNRFEKITLLENIKKKRKLLSEAKQWAKQYE